MLIVILRVSMVRWEKVGRRAAADVVTLSRRFPALCNCCCKESRTHTHRDFLPINNALGELWAEEPRDRRLRSQLASRSH